MLLYLTVDHLYGCFSCFIEIFKKIQDSAYNLSFKFSFILVFFWMVHNKNFSEYKTFFDYLYLYVSGSIEFLLLTLNKFTLQNNTIQ